MPDDKINVYDIRMWLFMAIFLVPISESMEMPIPHLRLFLCVEGCREILHIFVQVFWQSLVETSTNDTGGVGRKGKSVFNAI